MPAVANWGLIASGEVFQSLVNVLIAHKDPKASLFTRPGRDGAQDCVSGDRTTVYQAKFHADRRAARVLRDAEGEAEKIATYQQPTDPRHTLWQGKTRWILVTNAPFNANDRSKWNRDIVPIFASLGLVAECWTSGELESLLADYPEVYRAYFEGETRLFLSLSEAQRTLLDSEVIDPSVDSFRVPFAGRIAAFGSFAQFLNSDDRVLLVHGPGGIGKSWFLFEAACRAIDTGAVAEVYWGNLANLEASSAWYAGLVPERDALIVLDEPDDAALLRRVLEELRGSLRTASWKVVVAVRTPKNPVTSVLRDSRNRLLAREIELAPLDDAESVALAQTLADRFVPSILTQNRSRLIEILCDASGAYPMWMVVAIELLRSGQDLSDLPHDRFQLAQSYLDEIVTRGLALAEQKETLGVLRWMSLCQPVNSEDERVMDFIATQNAMSATGLLQAMVKLSARRAVRRSGLRKRVFAVTPDVLRDHILLAWLSFLDADAEPPRRRLSSGGEELVGVLLRMIEGAAVAPYLDRLLVRVGLIEFVLNREVDLLGPIAGALVDIAKKMSGAASRRELLARSTAVAFFRPAPFALFIRFLRITVATPEADTNPFRLEHVTQSDIVLGLAWPLFCAGTASRETGERRLILDEMAELTRAEAALGQSLPNDGRRAEALLRRLITNDAELSSSYHLEAYEMGRRVVAQLAGERPLGVAELSLAHSVLEPQLEFERTQSWSDHAGIHIARVQLDAEGELANLRSKLLDALWMLVVSHSGALQNRECVWKLLARAQRDANQGARRGSAVLVAEATQNLERALAAVSRARISLSEVQVARDVWNWNARFDEDPSRSALAAKCESILSNHPDAAGLVELLASDTSTRDAKRTEAVTRFASADLAQITRFFDRCVRFVAGSSEQWRLGLVRHIAFDIGKAGQDNAAVAAFACAVSTQDAALLEVRLGMLSGLLEAMRPAESAPALLRSALAAAEDDELRSRIVVDVYGLSAPVLSLNLMSAELDLVADRLSALLQVNAAAAFRVLGRFVGVDAQRVLRLARSSWMEVALATREECFSNLVNGIHERMLFEEDHPVLFGMAEWLELLELLVDMPDIDFGGNLSWTLNEVRRKVERLSPQWVVSLLERRANALASTAESESPGRLHRVHVVPHQGELFQWVRDVDPEDAEDRRAVDEVLSWVGRQDQVGYAAPSVLSRLDPKGALVPDLVAARLAAMDSSTPIDEVWNMARLGGHYVEDTPSWRKIAVPACRLARNQIAERDRGSIYGALMWHGPQSWSGRHGEFHPRWEQAVDEARSKLEKETDEYLQEYFSWRVRVAQAELDRERGLFEENER